MTNLATNLEFMGVKVSVKASPETLKLLRKSSASLKRLRTKMEKNLQVALARSREMAARFSDQKAATSQA